MTASNGNRFLRGKTAGNTAGKSHVPKERGGAGEARPFPYANPNCKKIRGSHILEVTCAYCKCFIAHYQKVGESNFVKMYNDRIIDGAIDFSQYHGAIFCPGCNERIATRYITKMDRKEAYRLVPSAFHKKKV